MFVAIESLLPGSITTFGRSLLIYDYWEAAIPQPGTEPLLACAFASFNSISVGASPNSIRSGIRRH